MGILPGGELDSGNDYLDVRIPTGLSHMRNFIVIASSAAVIALPGSSGTLNEMSIARLLKVPVVTLGKWQTEFPGVAVAGSEEEAVEIALKMASEVNHD